MVGSLGFYFPLVLLFTAQRQPRVIIISKVISMSHAGTLLSLYTFSSIACFAFSAMKQRLHRLDVVTINHQKTV